MILAASSSAYPLSAGSAIRPCDPRLAALLRALPAVLVTGPRAAGKTTSARRLAAEVLRLDDPAVAAAVASHPDDQDRVDRLLELVDGFETPYSLELLATVHFAASQQPPTADPAVLADRVAAWSLRKARLFTEDHVHLAAQRLGEHRLLPSPAATA